MEVNMVMEAAKFMALGMGTVFLFLVLMIVAMNVQSKLMHRYFPEPEPGTTPSSGAGATDGSKSKKIAAITAAIMHHKKING